MDIIECQALMGDKMMQESCIKNNVVLPCPFCGSEAKAWENASLTCGAVECTKCGCKISDYTKEKTLKAWNTRILPVNVNECAWSLLSLIGREDISDGLSRELIAISKKLFGFPEGD